MLRPQGYTVTLPLRPEYYIVNADQIDGLTKGGKSHSFEYSLACGGAAAGLILSSLDFVFWLIGPRTSLFPLASFCAAGLAVVLFVIAITQFMRHRSTKSDVDALVQRIKAGQKAEVS
jgi:hypothetical protein